MSVSENGASTPGFNGVIVKTKKISASTGKNTSKSGGSTSRHTFVIGGGKRGPGRPPKASMQAYIDTLKAEYPPDVVKQMLLSAWMTADETNSWRGKEAIIKLILAYIAGMPVKRVESSGDSSLADLLAGVDTSKPLMAGPSKDADEVDE